MITIIGAGMAGLLAGNMLRHKDPIIMEAQASLPNNHSAVLRFRSSVIGDVTGIPFRKVNVIKATLPWRNPVADALAYAEKNTGVYRSDRSIPTGVEVSERYIAPSDLIEQLAENTKISFSSKARISGYIKPVISTIPMPLLMDDLDYPGERPNFESLQGSNMTATIDDCDAYASLYVPDPEYAFSRISITGDELIVEVPSPDAEDEETLYWAAHLMGFSKDRITEIKFKKQKYAKILPVDDGLRKRFIAWASDEHGIYSLGRYACWRPGLLLDDLVQDIRLIDRWISGHGYHSVVDGSGNYAMRRHR